MAQAKKKGISRAELARRLGCSKAHVTKLGKQGALVELADGSIDHAATVVRIKGSRHPGRQSKLKLEPSQKNKKPQAEAPAAEPKEAVPCAGLGGGAQPSYNKVKAYKAYIDAQAAKVKLDRLKGELIPRAEVEKFVFEVLRATRTRVEAMPVKLAPMVASLGEKQAVADVMNEEVVNILNDLADALLGIPDAVVGKNS